MGGVVEEIHSLAIQADGKIVAAGHSVTVVGGLRPGPAEQQRQPDDGTVNDGTPFDGASARRGKVAPTWQGGIDAAMASPSRLTEDRRGRGTSDSSQSLMAVARQRLRQPRTAASGRTVRCSPGQQLQLVRERRHGAARRQHRRGGLHQQRRRRLRHDPALDGPRPGNLPASSPDSNRVSLRTR
jgi:hypothetical protein